MKIYPPFLSLPNISLVKKIICLLSMDVPCLKTLIPSCRDEFDRLVAVLNSRVMDLSNAEQRKENKNLTSRKDDEGLAVRHGFLKVSHEQRHEESTGAIWGTSTPPGLSKVSTAT